MEELTISDIPCGILGVVRTPTLLSESPSASSLDHRRSFLSPSVIAALSLAVCLYPAVLVPNAVSYFGVVHVYMMLRDALCCRRRRPKRRDPGGGLRGRVRAAVRRSKDGFVRDPGRPRRGKHSSGTNLSVH